MRLLPFSRLPGDRQLALSEAMLSVVQAPALRWRQIVPEALVLGHGQRLQTIDTEACRTTGHGVYRRATGGTAVLSGPELLGLDLVLPTGHPLAAGDVTRSYAWLGEAIAEALRKSGVAAATVSPEEARMQVASLPPGSPLRLACYATLSPYEVVVGGRKLVGLAQARRRSGVLYQAGIVLRWQPQRLAPLLAVEGGKRTALIEALRGRAVGLDDLGCPVPIDAVMHEVTVVIARAAGAVIQQMDWTEAELAAAAAAQLHCVPAFAVP